MTRYASCDFGPLYRREEFASRYLAVRDGEPEFRTRHHHHWPGSSFVEKNLLAEPRDTKQPELKLFLQINKTNAGYRKSEADHPLRCRHFRPRKTQICQTRTSLSRKGRPKKGFHKISNAVCRPATLPMLG